MFTNFRFTALAVVVLLAVLRAVFDDFERVAALAGYRFVLFDLSNCQLLFKCEPQSYGENVFALNLSGLIIRARAR